MLHACVEKFDVTDTVRKILGTKRCLKPGDSFAPEGSIPCALQWPGADSNGIGCAGAAIAQPLFVSFNNWVLRMAQSVCVLSLPTQLNYYCPDLLKAVPFERFQRHGLHLTKAQGTNFKRMSCLLLLHVNL